ncbi:hypothetical protein GCM10028864_32300 [Microlunatus parietis]
MGDHPGPVWTKIIRAAGIGAGTSVLDVGCGSGEWLGHLAGLGADVAGVDPAAGMIELARERLPGADLRVGTFDDLGFPVGTFDVVTAVNALQFAADPEAGLTGLLRATRPGGHVAIANWAEDARNDLFRIEQAIADATDAEILPGGPLREPGGLESLFDRAGLAPIDGGLVALAWQVSEQDLLRGTLLGHPPEQQDELTPVVLRAAAPFRSGEDYHLTNHFRYAITQTPADQSAKQRF